MNRRVALLALWVVFAGASVGVGFGAANLVGDPFTHSSAVDLAGSVSGAAAPAVSPGPSSAYPPTGGASTHGDRPPSTRKHPGAGQQTSTGPTHLASPGSVGGPDRTGPDRSSTPPPSGAASGASGHHAGSGSAGSRTGGATAPASGGSGSPSGDPDRSGGPSAGPTTGTSSTPTADPSRSITTRGGLVAGTCNGGQVTLSASPAVGWRIDEIRGGPSVEASVTFHQAGAEGEIQVDATCSGGAPRFAVQDHAGDFGASWGPSGSATPGG